MTKEAIAVFLKLNQSPANLPIFLFKIKRSSIKLIVAEIDVAKASPAALSGHIKMTFKTILMSKATLAIFTGVLVSLSA
jgi:hypothetical protein